MTTATWHDQWSQIDRSTDPAWFIRFLDASRKRLLEMARSNPVAFYPWARPGMHVLDVGCGTGDLLHPLAPLLGDAGKITALDLSVTLIAEARRRAAAAGVQISFDAGNATSLPYADQSFDVVTANLLLQHLPDPQPALAEMVRVLRPGGSLLIVEQDWDTLLIDHSDRPLTRRIGTFFCDAVPNGWIGRQLPAQFKRAGLENCTLVGNHQAFSAEEWLDPAMGLVQIAVRAEVAGVITSEERARWDAEIAARLKDGTFHSGFTMFRASATRPASGIH